MNFIDVPEVAFRYLFSRNYVRHGDSIEWTNKSGTMVLETTVTVRIAFTVHPFNLIFSQKDDWYSSNSVYKTFKIWCLDWLGAFVS